MTLTLGWWALPTLLALAAFAWAIPRRSDEYPTGGMFSEMSYVVCGGFRLLIALVLTLTAWLVWALMN